MPATPGRAGFARVVIPCAANCPVGAIQYGRKTAERGRYVDPVLK